MAEIEIKGVLMEIEIIEYQNFVSFVLEDQRGNRIHVQYRRDQVWLDQSEIWQINDEQRPFHVARLPPTTPESSKLSPATLRAIKEAAEAV